MKQALAYTRVSTQRQGESGFGRDAQLAQIKAYADQAGYRIVQEFSDVASGVGALSVGGRGQVKEAIREAHRRGIPLLVADLSRLSRDKASIDRLLDFKGLEIIVASLGNVDRNVIAGHAARAQREAEVLGQRTRDALARCKKEGKLLGNRTNLPEAQRKGQESNARRGVTRAKDNARAFDDARAAGAKTVPEIATFLNKSPDRYPTARGGPWTKENVHRVIRTLKRMPHPAEVLPMPSPEPIATPDGYLTISGAKRIKDVMVRRGLKLGQLMREIGYPALDASLGSAMYQKCRIRNPEKIKALARWLGENEVPCALTRTARPARSSEMSSAFLAATFLASGLYRLGAAS